MRMYKEVRPFYSDRQKQRVRNMERKVRFKDSLQLYALLGLLMGLLSFTNYKPVYITSSTPNGPHTSRNELSWPPESITPSISEPMDIQPAYGINQFQPATNGWTVQGGLSEN